MSGPVAQWITRLPTEQKIPGSNPGRFETFLSFSLNVAHHQDHIMAIAGLYPDWCTYVRVLSNECHYRHWSWSTNYQFQYAWINTKRSKTNTSSTKSFRKKGLENPGIDPGTSHMLSERSTIWATPPSGLPQIGHCSNSGLMDALLFGCLPERSGQVWLSGPDSHQFLDSLVVRISACHVEGPGSIPGRGGIFLLKSVQ